MRQPSILPLTSLRFFAAAAIVIYHMSVYGLMPFGELPALANGVSLFFVLSGFILAYNYPDMQDGIWRFYLSRFARLWPVHCFTLGLVIFLLPQLGNWATQPEGYPLFWSNLFLVQSWIPNSAHTLSFNGVAWSISAEMFFYAAFPLAIAASRAWLLVLFCFSATIAVVIYGHFSGQLSSQDPWAYTWTHAVLHFPPMRLFEFLTGIATARLFIARKPKGSNAAEIASIVMAITAVTGTSLISDKGLIGEWLGQCGSFLAFAVLIYVLASGGGIVARTLSHPWLVRMGEISFATYMVHQIVIRHAINAKMPAMWDQPYTSIAIIAAVYLASYAVWLMVEVPARRAILSQVTMASPSSKSSTGPQTFGA